MFHDARKLPDKTELIADVCVVGAGAAGISIGLEFLNTARRVVVLEGGQERYSAASQDLYDGENVGLPYEVGDTRARFFGGSTNCWGGWCRPLNELDFEARDWVPNSGWPISRADLDPYYVRAFDRCGLDDAPPDDVPEGRQHAAPQPLLPDSERVRTWTYGKSPVRRFGPAYRDRLSAARNIDVFLNANVTELEAEQDGSKVTVARAVTDSGNAFRVRASLFVLAAGGIENPRLLLLSRSSQPAGLGNGYDQVGRYFMEHPQFSSGELIYDPDDGANLDRYDSEQAFLTAPYLGTLGLQPSVQASERILGCTADIFAEYRGMRSDGYEALRHAVVAVRRGAWSAALGEHGRKIMADIGNVGLGLIGRQWRPRSLLVRREVIYICEPTPDPESRVTLSNDRDRLGLNKSKLDWKIDPLVGKSVRRTLEITADELRGAGLGEIRGRFSEDDMPADRIGWCWHHMGTTRMAASPRRGVVDSDCRVHGLSNLFVAGSSVFATGGTDTPTLSIVALAIRLADHLKGVLSPGPLPFARAWDRAAKAAANVEPDLVERRAPQ